MFRLLILLLVVSGQHLVVAGSQPLISAVVHTQTGGTCYANAVATAVRACVGRIYGRTLEDHSTMTDRIIAKHGCKGGSSVSVLAEECKRAGIRYAKVDLAGAKDAIAKGRVVLSTFDLTAKQWTALSKTYAANPKTIMISSDLPADDRTGKVGHAVVVSAYQWVAPGVLDSWRIKNSWGPEFADEGYFHVSSSWMQTVGAQFYDVFFYESDLTEQDRRAWAERHSHWFGGR